MVSFGEEKIFANYVKFEDSKENVAEQNKDIDKNGMMYDIESERYIDERNINERNINERNINERNINEISVHEINENEINDNGVNKFTYLIYPNLAEDLIYAYSIRIIIYLIIFISIIIIYYNYS